jgi:single-strand DNA-binding protein
MVSKTILLGNLGNDPEIRKTNSGSEIASFTLATSESYKDKTTNERKTITEWHKVVVFPQGLVDIVKKYPKKGSKVYIEGCNKTRKWTDEKNNIDRYTTEIVLQGFNCKLVLLDSKPEGTKSSYTSEDYKNKGAAF